MSKAISKAIFSQDSQYLSDERLLKTRSWIVHAIEYPTIDISFTQTDKKTLRVRLDCTGWNELPPSIELLEENGETLSQIPTGHGIFNASAHPKTQRPFICMIGSREYHEHSSHLTDLWDNYRGQSTYDLGGIITQIWNGWQKTK